MKSFSPLPFPSMGEVYTVTLYPKDFFTGLCPMMPSFRALICSDTDELSDGICDKSSSRVTVVVLPSSVEIRIFSKSRSRSLRKVSSDSRMLLSICTVPWSRVSFLDDDDDDGWDCFWALEVWIHDSTWRNREYF